MAGAKAAASKKTKKARLRAAKRSSGKPLRNSGSAYKLSLKACISKKYENKIYEESKYLEIISENKYKCLSSTLYLQRKSMEGWRLITWLSGNQVVWSIAATANEKASATTMEVQKVPLYLILLIQCTKCIQSDSDVCDCSSSTNLYSVCV